MLQRMDLVERVGSGLLRIRNALKERGLAAPVIDASRDWFSISFTRTAPRTREKTRDKTREKILLLLQQDPMITTQALAAETGVSPKGIEYHLAKLKQDHILSREGGRKTGRWVVR